MEQIKLSNGQTFNIVPYNGINQSEKELTINIIFNESLDNLYNIFSDNNNLETIKILSEDGEEVGILHGYVNLKEITRQKNVFLYTKEIKEVSNDTQDDSTETNIEDTQDDSIETKVTSILYEDVYGDMTIVKLNTLDIENIVKQMQKELETTQEAILELSLN